MPETPLQALRAATGEPTTANYSDDLMNEILAAAEGVIVVAAAEVWRRKAAATAKYFNSGNKNLEQIYKHNKEMADTYAKLASEATAVIVETSTRPKVRNIVRA